VDWLKDLAALGAGGCVLISIIVMIKGAKDMLNMMTDFLSNHMNQSTQALKDLTAEIKAMKQHCEEHNRKG